MLITSRVVRYTLSFGRLNLYLYFRWRYTHFFAGGANFFTSRGDTLPRTCHVQSPQRACVVLAAPLQRQRHLTLHRRIRRLGRALAQNSSSDERSRRSSRGISYCLRHSSSRPFERRTPRGPWARRRQGLRGTLSSPPVGDARRLRRRQAGSRRGAGARSAASLRRVVRHSCRKSRWRTAAGGAGGAATAASAVGEKQQAVGREIAPCMLIDELLMKASRMRCCRNQAIEQYCYSSRLFQCGCWFFAT